MQLIGQFSLRSFDTIAEVDVADEGGGDDNDDNDDNTEDDNDNDTISGVTWHWLWPIMRSLVTCQLTTYFTLPIPIL